MPQHMPARFLWVDGLRGIAALAVVIFHYHHFYLPEALDYSAVPETHDLPLGGILWLAYDYGMWAVQLFWIISGFVFAHVYFARPTTARGFFAARLGRLYPLHLATLLFVAGLQVLSLQFAGHWQIYGSNDLKHFLLQLVFASNWTTQSIGLSFNGPIWSVSLEMLVYLVFFLALGGLRRAPLWGALALTGAAWAIVWLNPGVPLIRIGVFECAGFFFAGSAIYAARALPWPLLCAGLAVLGGAGVWLESLNMALLGFSAALLVAVAQLDRAPALAQARPERLLGFLGDISYSIYLVHVPMQMVVLLVADLALGGSRAFADMPVTLALYLLAALGAAHAVHRWFERPVGAWLRRALAGAEPSR